MLDYRERKGGQTTCIFLMRVEVVELRGWEWRASDSSEDFLEQAAENNNLPLSVRAIGGPCACCSFIFFYKKKGEKFITLNQL